MVFRKVGGPVEHVSKATDSLHGHSYCSVARMLFRVHWTTGSRIEMLFSRGDPIHEPKSDAFLGGQQKGRLQSVLLVFRFWHRQVLVDHMIA